MSPNSVVYVPLSSHLRSVFNVTRLSRLKHCRKFDFIMNSMHDEPSVKTSHSRIPLRGNVTSIQKSFVNGRQFHKKKCYLYGKKLGRNTKFKKNCCVQNISTVGRSQNPFSRSILCLKKWPDYSSVHFSIFVWRNKML